MTFSKVFFSDDLRGAPAGGVLLWQGRAVHQGLLQKKVNKLFYIFIYFVPTSR